MKIAIENPVGSIRSGVDENGFQPWQTQMSAHYGYFEDTLGADGDELDVFVALGINRTTMTAEYLLFLKMTDTEILMNIGDSWCDFKDHRYTALPFTLR